MADDWLIQAARRKVERCSHDFSGPMATCTHCYRAFTEVQFGWTDFTPSPEPPGMPLFPDNPADVILQSVLGRIGQVVPTGMQVPIKPQQPQQRPSGGPDSGVACWRGGCQGLMLATSQRDHVVCNTCGSWMFHARSTTP